MITNFYSTNKIGDIIVFEKKLQLSENNTLTFSDVTTGETGNSYFIKKFRYAVDGVHFTNWLELKQANLDILTSELILNVQTVWLHFQYVYSGNIDGQLLTLNSCTINGVVCNKNYVYNTAVKTIFSNVVNDSLTYDLTINLAKKLFDPGIVPAFVERGDTSNSLEKDIDYIDFYTSVAHFYAMLYVYALKFTKIYYTQELLCEYLRERNLFFCGCSDLNTLQLLAQNFYQEFNFRGTIEVFRKKGFEYAFGDRYVYRVPNGYTINDETGVMIDGIVYYLGQVAQGGEFNDDFNIDFFIGINANSPASQLPYGWYYDSVNNLLFSPGKNHYQILFYNQTTGIYDISYITKDLAPATQSSNIFKYYDGEFLRLICYNNNCDEFLYLVIPLKYSGWNLGNSSPMYRGLRPLYENSIIKCFENSFNAIDINKYVPQNPNNISILTGQTLNLGNEVIANCSVIQMTSMSAIGMNGDFLSTQAAAVSVSPSLNYEISFWFKQSQVSPTMILSVHNYNCDFSVEYPLTDITTGLQSNTLLNQVDVPVAESNVWYFARFIIYGAQQKPLIGVQPRTSLSVGTNLIMDQNVKKLNMKLINHSNTGSILQIYNLKVKLCNTIESSCFLDTASLLRVFLKNNNKNYSTNKIQDISKRYLLPIGLPQSTFNYLM